MVSKQAITGGIITFLLFVLVSSCGMLNHWQIPELETVCVRYIGEDGYLYGVQLQFNSETARRVMNDYPFAHDGVCVDGEQGTPTDSDEWKERGRNERNHFHVNDPGDPGIVHRM